MVELALDGWQQGITYDQLFLYYQFLFSTSIVVNGQSAVTQEIRLPKNALVESYPVTLRAGAALWAPAQAVGVVRANPGQRQLVIDFGMQRTVNGVAVLVGTNSPAVKAWTGVDF